MDNNKVYELLSEKINKEQIYKDEPMKKHTSFKIGGKAEFFITVKTIEELVNMVTICNTQKIPLTIIGNGSNILVKDTGIEGVVLRIDIENLEIINKNNSKDVIVDVGAGMKLMKLSTLLAKENISGFEFASGIPGTIGGAIRMNAGAYGSEFKDIVIETTCVDTSGNIIKFTNEQQEFSYRSSIFKNNNYIIVGAKLLLKKVEDNNIIKEQIEEYRKSRMEKQPLNYPSAGSTFKRGNDFITAKLIDECGLKGCHIGGAEVSEKHAGFIINKSNATAEDVLNLVELVKKEVFKKFGKNIELEIEVIGK